MLKIAKKNVILFAILLIFIELMVFRAFVFSNKKYIYLDLGGDTFSSYFPYLWYLVNVVHKLNFSSWSFGFGVGTSVFTMESFFTDPFFLVFTLFNKVNFTNAFAIVGMLKVFICGILFYGYLEYFKFDKFTKIVLGVLFAFNSFLIVWGQHYQFASMFVYFTFSLYMLERYLQSGKYLGLILSLILLLVNSIYFSYMALIFFGFYYYFRLIALNKLNAIIKKTMGIILILIVSVLLSAFLLFPSVFDMLYSPRIVSSIEGLTLFFPFKVYIGLIVAIYTNWMDYILHVDYTNSYEAAKFFISLVFPLLLPIYFYNIIKNKNKFQIAIVIIALLPLLFPAVYLFMYRFVAPVYPKFRFTFIYIPLEVFLVGYVLSRDIISWRNILLSLVINIFILTGLMFYVIHLNQAVNYYLFIKIFIFLILYSIVLPFYSTKLTAKLLFLFMLVLELIWINSKVEFKDRTVLAQNYITQAVGYYDTTNQIIDKLNKIDNSFYRVDKSFNSASPNDAVFQDYYGFATYNSLNNPSYLDLMNNFNPDGYTNISSSLDGKKSKNYNILVGFGDNQPLYTLMGEKYKIQKSNEGIPFGYGELYSLGDDILYKNNNYLSIAQYYPLKSCLNYSDFAKLTIKQKTAWLYKGYVDNNCMSNSAGVIESLEDSYSYIQAVNNLHKSQPKVEYNRSKSNILKVNYNAKEDGYIIFYIPYYPFWHAVVNGRKVSVQKLSVGFVGVYLKKGESQITVFYRNDALWVGCLISAITAILFLLFSIVRNIKLKD